MADRLSSADPYADSPWNQFLIEGERIVFTGLITKKTSLFTHKRQLILTDLPRFVYVDPEKMVYKKDIPWDSIRSDILDDMTFTIRTPHRTYVIKGLTTGARGWVEEIEKMSVIVEREQAKMLSQLKQPVLLR